MNKNLIEIAFGIWIKEIDRTDNEIETRRNLKYQMKKYNPRPSEILEKIKKCKYSKRLY